ncbi:CPBP family intramembrane metalloprotease [Clostridium perfringens]|nr:CPBP family intramembrane metalloprotease [Clostridium perfringens]
MEYNKIVNNINNYLMNLSVVKYILLILLLTYVVFIPFLFLFSNYDFNVGGPQSIINSSFWGKLFIGSLLAPIFETFVFQYMVIESLDNIKIKRHKNFFILIISSIFFSLTHTYSFIYIFYSFVIGMFLAYTYILYKKKNFHPFLIVTIIHSLRNTITTLLFFFNV